MKNLILATVFVAFLSYAQAGKGNETLQEVDECKEQTNVSEADMALILEKQLPKEREGKCFMACVMKKFDVMTEDGKMNVEGMKAMAAETPGMEKQDVVKMEKVADDCNEDPMVQKMGDDECDNALIITECTTRKVKEYGIKIAE